jgi:dynein heavy chain 2
MSSYWPNHPISKQPKKIEDLAKGMTQVYTGVRNAFSPVSQSHYLFTPRDLTNWSLGLMRYSCTDEKDVFFAWCFESCRIFKDKLVSDEEKHRYMNTILLPVANKWGITQLDEVLQGRFVDYKI